MDDESQPRFPKRMTFRMGDVFAADDPLAQWATNLCRALNDLLIARGRLKRGYAADAPVIESFYDIRAVATHSWELAKFLFESERDSEVIRDFVSELPEDVVREHQQAVAVLYGDAEEDSRFRGELGSARDQATHYSRIDHKLMRAALGRLREVEAEILLGRRFGDFRAEFAATLDAQLFFAVEHNTKPFESFSIRLNQLSQDLVHFCRIAIDHYLLQHKDRLEVGSGPDAEADSI